jgi:hypothetical protein
LINKDEESLYGQTDGMNFIWLVSTRLSGFAFEKKMKVSFNIEHN